MQGEVLINRPKKPSPTGDHLWKQIKVSGIKQWVEQKVKQNVKIKGIKKEAQYRRQDTHEQLKQEKFQVEGKDHHKSSTQRHMVSSRSNDEGNILR